MFHLLTAVSDAGAFPIRRPYRDTIVENSAVARDVSATPAAAQQLLTIGGRSSYQPILCCGLLSIALLFSGVATEPAQAQNPTSASTRTAKIENALTAAPEEIARNAAVKDWPTKEGEGLAVLRPGTNGWVCLPDDPTTPGNDPTCMDQAFHDALVAYFTGQVPKVTRVAYAYMLTSDAEGSNTDPTAKGPTPNNQWHHAGPHVMVLYPDAKLLQGLPTTPSATGPYVMFAGTPIAHVMLPVQSGYLKSRSHNAQRNP